MWFIEVKHSDRGPNIFQVNEKDGGEGEAKARYNLECALHAKVRAEKGGITEIRLFKNEIASASDSVDTQYKEVVYQQARIESVVLLMYNGDNIIKSKQPLDKL